MIGLIVIDLDGTLLNSDKSISRENEEAIIEALGRGVHVSISTGRSYVSGHKYVEQLGISVPVSYQNGALVIEGYDGAMRIISQCLLGTAEAVEIYNRSRERGLNSLIFFDFFKLPDISTAGLFDSPYRGYYAHNAYRIVLEEDPSKRIREPGIAEIAIEGEEERIIEMIEAMRPGPDRVTVVKNDALESHAFYEFFGPGVGKSNGLQHILEHLKIDREEVAYIGDNYNDLDILKRCPLPVVMANAPDQVKEHAKIVTEKTNDESGVAEAIDRILNWRRD
ncbi:MAG: Cof-type HAD-IIB family hydrolase [Mesotoga sp.]|nr:Cof-type HAD-IIB family hydrolase [Mesotoga sp.]